MKKQKRRFRLEKLGRDNINVFLNKGIEPKTKRLTKPELSQALKEKLLEESQEVFHATQKEELIEEIADVKEVLLALLKFHDIEEQDVETIRLAKKERSGGFEQGIYYHYADYPLDCPDLHYLLAHPNKYSEIEVEAEE